MVQNCENGHQALFSMAHSSDVATEAGLLVSGLPVYRDVLLIYELVDVTFCCWSCLSRTLLSLIHSCLVFVGLLTVL